MSQTAMTKRSLIQPRDVLVLLVVALITGGVWSCRRAAPAKDVRHIILISIDTCRADYLSCYGYKHQTTPNIDRFAQEGILFTNTISPVPITLPAHSSMLTGTIPPYHGVRNNIGYKLGQSNVTLAEILSSKGYTTAGFISTLVLDSKFAINQGFDTYDDKFEQILENSYGGERLGQETTSHTLKWLEENKDEKFFLFLHYYDPHYEYRPPEPFASRFADSPYAGEIAYTDYCIGQVIEKLKELGLYESALIIITADHGEMLGEHGEDAHMFFIYQSAIKVPLIFKLPGVNEAKKVDNIVGLVDIVPTICSFVGIKPPHSLQGRDLSPYFYAKQPIDMKGHLYTESLVPSSMNANSLRAVVNDRWKYIQTTRPELYDLIEDPDEMNNLVKQQPQQARILQDSLKQILLRNKQPDYKSRTDLDEKTLKQLESLGYVSGVGKKLKFDQSREDPKDLIEFFNSGQEIRRLIARKEYQQAKVLCEELLSRRPDIKDLQNSMAEVSNHLGIAMVKQGKMDLAVPHFKKAVEMDPNMIQAQRGLALAFTEQKKFDQAIEHYEKSLQIDPAQPIVFDKLAELYYRQDQPQKALDYWKKALQFKPDWPEAFSKLAWVKTIHKDKDFHNPKQALQLAQRACELTNYQSPNMLNALAAAYAAADNFSDAVKTAEKALNLARLAGANELVSKIQSCLELYRQQQPYYSTTPSQNW